MQRFQSRISNKLSEVMLETRTSSDEKSQGFIHKEAFERYLSLTYIRKAIWKRPRGGARNC